MNDAEMLIDLADSILYPRDEVLLCEGLPPSAPDTAVLALRLKKRPDLTLRAIMEDWSRFRIVRELY